MGERSPHNGPDVRGMFYWDEHRTQQEMDELKRCFEGVAFAIRDSIEFARALGIEIKRSTICGGGAKESVVGVKLWLMCSIWTL